MNDSRGECLSGSAKIPLINTLTVMKSVNKGKNNKKNKVIKPGLCSGETVVKKKTENLLEQT